MSAPQFVPTTTNRADQHYVSPPRTRGSWMSDRPGEIRGGQPVGEAFGAQGPDQGYALKLATQFELYLKDGEHREDVEAGVVLAALRRASHFGRAPVIHDLRMAYTLFGFLDPEPDDDLVTWRRKAFEGVANPHHYFERLEVANRVPLIALTGTPISAETVYRNDWRTAVGF